MKILADATLSNLDIAFPSPFQFFLYHNSEELSLLLSQADILLCRSTLKVDRTLLRYHCLQVVATASSGYDHIDVAYLKTQNISLMDANGSNAIAVGDYVLSVLAHLQTVAAVVAH